MLEWLIGSTVALVVSLIVLIVCVVVPILVIAVPVLLIMGVVKLLTIGSSRRRRHYENDEARTMQEIHRGLARMEQRLEALETVMFERDAGEAWQRR
jgi:phage shock protein B